MMYTTPFQMQMYPPAQPQPQTQPALTPTQETCLIIDIGSYALRISCFDRNSEVTLARRNGQLYNAMDRSMGLVEIDCRMSDLVFDDGHTFRTPFTDGVLTDLDLQTKILDECLRLFYQLRSFSPPTTHLFLVFKRKAEMSPDVKRKLIEWVFHRQYRSICCSSSAFLTRMFFSARRTEDGYLDELPLRSGTVLVVDAGYSGVMITPIIRGSSQQCIYCSFAGYELEQRLKDHLLTQQSTGVHNVLLHDLLVKETLYVSENYHEEALKYRSNPEPFSLFLPQRGLPGGLLRAPSWHPISQHLPVLHEDATLFHSIIELGKEQFALPEILFQPHQFGIPGRGIVESVAKVLSLYSNQFDEHLTQSDVLAFGILLTGGLTRIRGFTERFKTDLRSLLPDTCEIQINHSQFPHMDASRGATIFTTQDWFDPARYQITAPLVEQHDAAELFDRYFTGL